jgi:hypothetical protein
LSSSVVSYKPKLTQEFVVGEVVSGLSLSDNYADPLCNLLDPQTSQATSVLSLSNMQTDIR